MTVECRLGKSAVYSDWPRSSGSAWSRANLSPGFRTSRDDESRPRRGWRAVHFASAICLASMAPSVAFAREQASLYPVQIGAETARYRQGVPTLHLETSTGAVEMRPLPVSDRRLSFAVAVYNKGEAPANFGPENVWASIGPTLTVDELEAEARRRATGRKIATALVAGTIAGIASTASTHGTYYGWTPSRRGPVPTAIHWEDNTVGVVGAAAAVGGGVMAIHGIDKRLDYTLGRLGDEILQTNTVDPGASFGGVVVVPMARDASTKDIRVTVRWNGHDYPFAFRLSRAGEPKPPPFESATPAEVQIDPEQLP